MASIRARSSKKGISLAEVMIAAVLFVGVVTSLLVGLTACIILTQSNSNLIIAAADAQYILEEVKSLAYSDITLAYLNANYPSNLFNNLDNEAISFQVTGAGVREVVVDVDWVERGTNKQFRLSTRIAP